MSTIGFIGVGNMGGPMARNLLKAGHAVAVFDLVPEAAARCVAAGATAAATVGDAIRAAEIIVTMLPAGKHVREVYLGAAGVLAAARPGTLLIDSSTIDVESARSVGAAAARPGST